jgi:hypothetical protein
MRFELYKIQYGIEIGRPTLTITVVRTFWVTTPELFLGPCELEPGYEVTRTSTPLS